MLNLKEVNAPHDTVETAHKEIIAQDQAQNKERANQSLTILPDEAKQNVMESCKYSSYFPNPITKPFMRKYILAKIEFPTKGSELAQSLTELNVRIDNLFGDAYTFEKTKLEVEGLDIEIEELEAYTDTGIEGRKIQNKIALKQLELANKKYSLNKTKLAALSRYNEAMGWKGCVEDIMGEIGLTSLDQFDFNQVRMDEMSAKVKKWGELQANEMLEMTPSKLNVIMDSQEDFQKGFYKGSLAVEYKTYQEQLPQLETEIVQVNNQAVDAAKRGDEAEATKLKDRLILMQREAAQIRLTVGQIEKALAAVNAEESFKTKLLK
jgi:hypothetical protein